MNVEFNRMVRDEYTAYFGLDGADEAKWRLIRRYHDKISPRLKKLREELLAKAEKKSAERFSAIMTTTAIFGKCELNTEWVGREMPVPIPTEES